jgi:putative Holliday junction resolvase
VSETERALPDRGRLIGVDFGTVRIGLAVCDADRLIASPLETYARRGPESDAEYFRKLSEAEGAVGWVVGLPLMTLTGDEGAKAKEFRAFGDWLTAATGLPVAYQDERYTSSAAEDALWDAGLTHRKRKDRRDRVAAQLILQSFLEAREPG